MRLELTINEDRGIILNDCNLLYVLFIDLDSSEINLFFIGITHFSDV